SPFTSYFYSLSLHDALPILPVVFSLFDLLIVYPQGLTIRYKAPRTSTFDTWKRLFASSRPTDEPTYGIYIYIYTVRRLICWSAAGEKSFPRVKGTGSRGLVSNCEPLGINYEKVK